MRRFFLIVGVMGAMLAFAAPALATSPTVTTGAPSGVGSATVRLNGTVVPNTSTILSCQFEYGPTTSYGSTASCQAGTTTNSETVAISGLTPATAYHYNLMVTYLDPPTTLTPTTATGQDVQFVTNTATNAHPPNPVTQPATNVYSTSAQLNGQVTPGDADVTDCHFAYGTSATALTSTVKCQGGSLAAGSNPVTVSAQLPTLTKSTKYYFALVAASSVSTQTGSTLNFTTSTTPPPAPTATNQAADGIGDTTATLHGTVNSKSVGVSGCAFEYGPTPNYGQTAPCSPMPTASNSDQAVSAALGNLSTGTTYYYRVVIATGGGVTRASNQPSQFVTTGPVTSTQPATGVTGSGAVLHGTANAEGETVTGCAFYYGTTVAYGHSAPCSPSSVSGNSTQNETAALSGLAPKTTYHYLLAVTTTSGATSYGGDLTFTTLAEPTGATLPATGVTSNAGVLHGTVNSQGVAVIACVFQYGISPFGYGGGAPYGLNIPCSPTPKTSTANQSVLVALHGLAGRTTYYYRVVLETQAGYFVGQTLNFRTAAPLGRPGVRITKAKIGHGTAKFTFRSTGPKATKYECALAKLNKKGKVVGRVRYSRCRSPKTYKHLHGRYEFFVKAGNAAGYGAAKTRKFKL